MIKGLYAGSFDPFTKGHLYIVEEASQLVDELHIVIFNNSSKTRHYSVSKMLVAMQKEIEKIGINNCIVRSEDCLLAKYCRKENIKFNFRGLRNGGDFEYESNLSFANNIVYPELHTVYLQAKNEYLGLSSTVVRELLAYGEDVSTLVPKSVLEIL